MKAHLTPHGTVSAPQTPRGVAAASEVNGIHVGIRMRPVLDPRDEIRMAHRQVRVDTEQHRIECPDCSVASSSSTSSATKRTTNGGTGNVFDFTFDRVFGPYDTQEMVMATVGNRAVDQVLSGYNGTVLCYGQSGSGKTHTMIGPSGGRLESVLDVSSPLPWSESQVGLLPRVLFSLFEQLQMKYGDTSTCPEGVAGSEHSASPAWFVELSAVELYNEELRDLLPTPLPEDVEETEGEDEPQPEKPTKSRTSVSLSPFNLTPGRTNSTSRRESVCLTRSNTSLSLGRPSGSLAPDGAGDSATSSATLRICQMPADQASATGMSVCVEGLRRHPVSSFTQAMSAVYRALQDRTISATRLNSRSNRSHILFFLYLRQKEWPDPPPGSARVAVERSSILTLVDLAGSERVSQTKAEGMQLFEAQRINLSLTLLGNVISRLSSRAKPSHIPYRDSKLTRLLQDSFGGHAVTYLLCTISPEERHRSETLSTLRFAQLAKRVKNKARRNTAVSLSEVEVQLKQAFDYIAWLEQQLKMVASCDTTDIGISIPSTSGPAAPWAVEGAAKSSLPKVAVPPCSASGEVATGTKKECREHSPGLSTISSERGSASCRRELHVGLCQGSQPSHRPVRPTGVPAVDTCCSPAAECICDGNVASNAPEGSQLSAGVKRKKKGRVTVDNTDSSVHDGLTEGIRVLPLCEAAAQLHEEKISEGFNLLPVGRESLNSPLVTDPCMIPFDGAVSDGAACFLNAYGHSASPSLVHDCFRFHPLSTPSTETISLHPLTSSLQHRAADAESWDEPDLGEFAVGSAVEETPKRRNPIQRMTDAIRLAAAIVKRRE